MQTLNSCIQNLALLWVIFYRIFTF
jgi:hypothetical protein